MPLGKLGYQLPRTLSNAVSRDADEPEPFHIVEHLRNEEHVLKQRHRHRRSQDRQHRASGSGDLTPGQRTPQRPIFRIGGSIIEKQKNSGASSPVTKEEGRSTGDGLWIRDSRGPSSGLPDLNINSTLQPVGGDVGLKQLEPSEAKLTGGQAASGQADSGAK